MISALRAAWSFFLFNFVPLCLAGAVRRATVCNGHAELCGRSYSNVTFIGAHDSYAVGSNNVAANQDYDVTQQLTDGIRMLQNQVIVNNGVLHLCHTACALYDGGALVNYLVKVKNWMVKNPTEVVTLLLVNINDQPASSFASVFESAGLSSMSFMPSTPQITVGNWPTLGSMIDSGQRLVTFLDHEADFNSAPYIMDEFTNVWETAFDVTTADWPCDVNRTNGDPTTKMYLTNHFLDQNAEILGIASTLEPAKSQLNVTNAATGPGSIGAEITNCLALHGVPPNFILLDFYDYGNGAAFDVAAQLNGVPNPTHSPAPPIINNPSATGGTETSFPIGSGFQLGIPSLFWLPLCHIVLCLVLGGRMLW